MQNVRYSPRAVPSRGRTKARWLPALAPIALALATAVPGAAQQTQVTGTVTSSETGGPLGGVQVVVKGTAIGVLTNGSGRFTLQVPNPNDTLSFVMIGFAGLDEPINGRNVVDVTLEVSAVALEEFIVIGYGTQQRRDLTGSVARVEGSKVAEVSNASVAQALQGKIAGVQVTPSSGEPGQDAIIRIRGVGTLNDASPLYVVDGMLVDDIQFLPSEDIESVDVLKDASATAIYGSRGANGVIIITTKRGVEGQRTTYTLRAYGGTQRVLDKIDLVNAQQYAELSNELAANQNQPLPFPNGYTGPSTDWQDVLFEDATIQNYQFTASGATERVNYYFSGSYIDQAGVLPHSAFQRATLRVNNDYELSDRIVVGHNLNFTHTDDERPASLLSELYRAEPTVTPMSDAGEFNPISLASGGNPAATSFYNSNNEGGGQRLVGNLYGEATFLDGFTFRSSFGLDYERTDFRRFVPEFVVDAQQQNVESDINVEFENTDSWLWENTLTWNRATDQHRLTVLGGITAQSFYSERFGGARVNVAGDDPSLWYLDAAAADGATNFNRASDWKMFSYLFRTNYVLMDRYLFTGSLRVDGSSRFGEENRYGWFPSFAAGWDLAQEDFLADVDAISALKLRGSWGKIGNDKIGAYPSVALVSGNLNYVIGDQLQYGASPIALANPAVRWEETEQFNFGVDAALFRSRVTATFDYYRRTTDGILVQVPIPNYVGASEPFVNAAKVRNSGFEGTIDWTTQIGSVNLELSANGSTIDNEVLELGEGKEELFGANLSGIGFSTRTVPGEPIGSFWGWRVAGVFQNQAEVDAGPRRGGEQPGDLKFADLNGFDTEGNLTGQPDGVINDADKTFLGSPIPDFVYGFDATIRVGAFDLGVGFSGQSGNEVYNYKRGRRFEYENYEEQFLARWNGEGTSNFEPRITTSGHNYQSSDRWIEDGSFLKLHTARLGVRLPQTVSQRMGVDAARLYVSGTNLLLWSDYTGYTPELTAPSVIANGIDQFDGVYPPSRTITFGIDLTF